ncbi:hypothetical protein [Chloroflexus sp.]|uniref:hypothetical protein n=1 Tax=Chloroflexus sp. TaxID=1904827 RepID=UPI002630C67F|nr:hypothetical protein [uncultured Chloroflexus sp.]
MAQPSLRTVSVVRRGYGRRYTDLPVDELNHQRLVIDCAGGYLRPDLIDLRQGDVVYWREQERYVEGRIGHVRRDDQRLIAIFKDVTLMPEDFFPY